MNLGTVQNRSMPPGRLAADLRRLQEAGRGAAEGQTPEQQKAGLKAASKAFESVFVYQVVTAMRKTTGHGGLFEKSSGEKIFESMLDEEWSKRIAGQGGSNSLGELLYRQLASQLGLEEKKPTAGDATEFIELTQRGGPAVPLPPAEGALLELEPSAARFIRLRPASLPARGSHE